MDKPSAVPEVDLHFHSIFSDGSDWPEEIAKKAKHLKGLSLTDHNSCDGFLKFMLACTRHEIDMISGIEISCALDSVNIHILGYGFKMDDKSAGLIRQSLKKGLEGANKRASILLGQVYRTNILGRLPEVEEINQEFGCPGKAVSVHHLFHYCSKKSGIPYRKLYKEFGRGKKFWADPFRETMLNPKEAIKLMTDTGGVAVLAHPYKLLEKMPLNEFVILLDRLCAEGLFGLETHYLKHNSVLIDLFAKLAEERGLFQTAGSDYHGFYKKRDIGMPGMSYQDFLIFKKKILARRNCA